LEQAEGLPEATFWKRAQTRTKGTCSQFPRRSSVPVAVTAVLVDRGN